MNHTHPDGVAQDSEKRQRFVTRKEGCWGPGVKIGPVEIPLVVAILVFFGFIGGGVFAYYASIKPNVIEPLIAIRVEQTVAARLHTVGQPMDAPCPTSSPCPVETQNLRTIDSMDSEAGWTQYASNEESHAIVSLVDGQTDKAVQIAYELADGGYVSIAKPLRPCQLFDTRGIRFHYKGNGAPNTVELKLVYYPDLQGRRAYFGVMRHQATDTKDQWIPMDVLYTEFKCWPDTGCNPEDTLEIDRVQTIDIAISNKPAKGDVPGSGVVLIDNIVAFR